MYNWKIGQSYNFDTLAPVVLGASVNNLKLVAQVDFNTAKRFSNIAITFQQIIPFLNNNVDKNPELHTFLVFKSPNQDEVVLSDKWINESTIREYIIQKAIITISPVDNVLIDQVRTMLSTIGITNIDIQKVNN